MSEESERKFPAAIVIGVALLITAAAYLPGLAGSFVFDDSTFLINNLAIKVTNSTLPNWAAAAMSFPATHQGRWLGMLSFAANFYLTGMDPYWFKLTNLVIHLANGLFLFLGLRALFDLHHASANTGYTRRAFDSGLAAAALAALWLALPINLTGVLYISQRLESLSNTLVFMGLWWYFRARLAHWHGTKSAFGMWLALIASTGLGLLVKESAVLLPLYAACADFALTGGRDREGQWSKPVIRLYTGLLILPLVAGLVWLGGWVSGPRTYARAFDIPQRLMTEARVLFHYMHWTLAPSLDSLTLYHDDIKVSRGLLSPPTTLISILAIAALIAAAFWQRSRRPLFTLGIFWFFAGHLLTATVIPLMLVFEHRNYFPSVGLLLASASLLSLEGLALRARAIVIGATCVFAFYAFTTTLRAHEWSSSFQLAATDAEKRPDSSAAQFEYARALLGSTLNGESEPMRKKAFKVLERMAARPDGDIVHNQLLITTSAELGLPIKPEWWTAMIAKLRANPPTSVEASALIALLGCYESKVCPPDVAHLRDAFAAAAAHNGGFAPLASAHGQFALEYLDDKVLAERQFRGAANLAPSSPEAQTSLVIFLIKTGRSADAEIELTKLRKLNHLGILDQRIADLAQSIKLARGKVTPPSMAIPK